jgi:vacuolar-type H+-ATPase subunit E/Vma4
MALQEILSQVEKAGQKQVEDIRKATNSEVESKLSEARDKGKEIAEEIASETRRQIEQLESQEIPAAELEVKRNRLDSQRRALESTRKIVLANLGKLSKSDLEKVYKKLVSNLPKEGTLHCRKEDAALVGKLTKVKLGSPIDGPGFVVETKDYRLDYRFSTLVEKVWQENLPVVSEELFGK